MDLILWRHAEAEPGEPDLGRRLTAKGARQAERMATWLDSHLPDTCRVLVSPAERAQQTASALKRSFKTVPDLAPGATVDALLRAAGWPGAREPVLIVGHQPTLGETAAFLLSGAEAPWSVRKAALWWLSGRARERSAEIVLKVVIGPDHV
jgi:phosphohistidine phosphatase